MDSVLVHEHKIIRTVKVKDFKPIVQSLGLTLEVSKVRKREKFNICSYRERNLISIWLSFQSISLYYIYVYDGCKIGTIKYV